MFGLIERDGFHLVRNQRLERRPELTQQRHPFFFATRDRIEIIFHARGEFVVDVLREMVGQELGHDATDVGWSEATIVEHHVFAPEQGLDDAGVSRRTADAVFLQRLDQ